MAIAYTTPTGSNVWDVRGLSTDEKPTESIPNGSTFYEMDTQNVFMFNGESGEWIPQ